ncbi:hypothetical protein ACLOJK_000666 [Asimina triloba]
MIRSPDPPESGVLACVRSIDPQCTHALLDSGVLMPIIRSLDSSVSGALVDDYLKNLPINALPGVGYALAEKLKLLDVRTCGQLRMLSKENLRKDFGMRTGDMLWNYSRGIDNQPVEMIKETKSIGAEISVALTVFNLPESRFSNKALQRSFIALASLWRAPYLCSSRLGLKDP